MTAQEILDKIEWEGGLIEVIDYGVKSDNVPPAVAHMWREAVATVHDFRMIERKVISILQQISDQQLDNTDLDY